MQSSNGKLSEQELNAFQEKYHLDLPEDYKRYLRENNGGSTENVTVLFRAKRIKEWLSMGELFGVNHPVRGLSIETWQDEYDDELVENMVIIGALTFPGLLLLVNREDMKGVYLWDHTLEFETSTRKKCVYTVADTFDDFLNSLRVVDDDDEDFDFKFHDDDEDDDDEEWVYVGPYEDDDDDEDE